MENDKTIEDLITVAFPQGDGPTPGNVPAGRELIDATVSAAREQFNDTSALVAVLRQTLAECEAESAKLNAIHVSQLTGVQKWRRDNLEDVIPRRKDELADLEPVIADLEVRIFAAETLFELCDLPAGSTLKDLAAYRAFEAAKAEERRREYEERIRAYEERRSAEAKAETRAAQLRNYRNHVPDYFARPEGTRL